MSNYLNQLEIAEDEMIIKIDGGELGDFYIIGGLDEKRRYYLTWIEEQFKNEANPNIGKHYFLYKYNLSPDFIILYFFSTDGSDIITNTKKEYHGLSTVLRDKLGVAYYERYNTYKLQSDNSKNYKIILNYDALYRGIIDCLKTRKTIKLIDDVDSFEQAVGDYLFYRGNTSYDYSLTPSLFRNKSFIDHEREMFLEYIDACPTEDQCKSDYETLTKMQHYGLPTRLLDVTTDKYVALFMACSTIFGNPNGINDIGKVYAFKKPIIVKPDDDIVNGLMKQIRYGQNHDIEETLEPAVFIEYSEPDNNHRMLKQKGSFMLFVSGEYPKDKCDSVYVINKKAILEELNEKGYNEKELVPELEHLCHYIRQKYENKHID